MDQELKWRIAHPICAKPLAVNPDRLTLPP